MLVLSRKVGEQTSIGDDVYVTVLSIQGNRVRLGFAAPPEVHILREELDRFDCEAVEPALQNA